MASNPIQTVKQRSGLTPRREPYWHAIGTGRHIGYRSTDKGGSWIARAYDPGTRTRVYQALPEVSRLPASEQFNDAARRAREWFEHLDKGGESEIITVWDACKRYVKHVRKTKGDKAADDAEHRLERDVKSQPIANIELHKLAKRHCTQWREYMEGRPAKSPHRGKSFADHPDRQNKKKSAATINRDMVPFRAALNLAKADDFVLTDNAWRKPLEPIKNADGQRKLYLDKQQRNALIEAIAEPELIPFAHTLCLLPLRPGALAAATAGDFHATHATLAITKDKSGAGRTIPLSDALVDLFKKQKRGKLPGAHLFTRAGGKPWHKDAWKGPIKAAAHAAELPAETTIYTLRHSVITDLVTGGLDIFTVARLAGTSVRMIEQHYGHLVQRHARDALAGLAV